MSTPVFLALSLALATLLALLAFASGGFRQGSPEAVTARLQGKLAMRLAHGTDRFFEERRSLELAIAENAAAVPVSAVSRWLNGMLIVACLVFASALLISMWGPSLLHIQAPAWSKHLANANVPLFGFYLLVNPPAWRSGGSTRIARLIGLLLVASGIFTTFQLF